MIAIAGVALMFVFVIGDPLMQYMGGSSSGGGGGTLPGEVAVSWDGGDLTNAELSQLVYQRVVVNAFLRNVEYIGRSAAYDSGVEPQPLRVEMIAGPERPQDGVERDVLRTHVFAEQAKAEGMRISDQYIVDYLQQLGRGYVTVDIIRQIIAQMQSAGRPVTDGFILDALRQEMLSRNFLASYAFSLDTLMPEQKWQDWLRVNDRIVLEAAAVPVASFVVDVPDPTDAELVAFYDQYKNREPQPERTGGLELPSPLPGFAKPRKVDLQYLRADFNKFLTKVEDEVTDAEIEKFYEDNKDPIFVSADSMLYGGDEQPAAEEANEGDAKPAADAAPADGAESAPEDNDQSSAAPTNKAGTFRLAAFQPEDTAAESTGDSATAAAPENGAKLQVSDAFPTDPDAAAEPPKKFQPLEEVRDEIRRQIAEVRVSDQLEKLMGEIEHELNAKYTDYIGAVFDADAAGKPVPPPPAELADLTAVAEKHGLAVEKTGPVSFLELRDLPIGLSAQAATGNIPLLASVFGRELELYQPISSFDLDNNRYIAMKTSDVAGSVPDLADVRSDVVRAYKLQKAADLALARAKDLAKKAQDSGSSLEVYFESDRDVKVIKTDPFAFLTVGNISRDTQQVQSFRLSEPDGIVAAGPEFMQTVFNLGEGDVGAVLNHDHTQAYVVRIAEHLDTPAKLQQDFLAEADNWYGIPAMGREHAQIAVRVLLEDLLKSANVDWKRTPDSMNEPTEEES
jgi:hypothetical protein